MKDKIKNFFTKKRIIWSSIIFVIVILILIGTRKKPEVIQTEVIKKIDIEKTVLATGTVVSGSEASLSFAKGGLVKGIKVKVGDEVKENQVLAFLDQRNELASLSSARAMLASAKARKQKLLEGITSEEIEVLNQGVLLAESNLLSATKNLENTKTQQDILVKNAKNALYSNLVAVPSNSSISTSYIPIVSGNYNGEIEGDITVVPFNTGGGQKFSFSGLSSGSGNISSNAEKMGDTGMFLTFPVGSTESGTTFTISIPNKNSAYYVSNLSAYNNALQSRTIAIQTSEQALATAKITLDTKKAELAVKKANAKPSDILQADADIQSAEASVNSAYVQLSNTEIIAPVAGTVTMLDLKLGELATAFAPVAKIQDVKNLYLEASINETNIGEIKTGTKVLVTFDSLPEMDSVETKVFTVEQGSSVVGGVVSYKIKSSLPLIAGILPGMTANMTIIIDTKPQVIAVIRSALVKKDDKTFVRILTNLKKALYEEVEVKTGLEADRGYTEILNGLKEGQTIVTFTSVKNNTSNSSTKK